MSLPPDAQALVADVTKLATQALSWTRSKNVTANIKAMLADVQQLTALWPAPAPPTPPPTPDPTPPPTPTPEPVPVPVPGARFPDVAIDSPGWDSHAVQLAPGVSSGPLQVGTFPTQTDVVLRHPDGSIKQAQVTCKATGIGLLPIAAGSAASGTAFVPASWPAVVVTLTIDGFPTQIAFPTTPRGLDVFYAGPLMHEERIILPTSRAWVRLVADMRSFVDGGHRVDLQLRADKDTADAKMLAYDVAVTINGAVVFERKGQRLAPRMGWRKTFPVGLTEATVRPGVQTLQALKAIPTYLSTIQPVKYGPFVPGPDAGCGMGWDIGQTGLVQPSFPATGARPDLAPYPQWVAEYATFRTADALDAIIRMGDLCASWPVSLRNGDGSFISIDFKPDWWLGDANGVNGPLNKNVDPYLTVPSTGAHQNADRAHQPSLAIPAWLFAGDRFHADMAEAWAHFCLLAQPQANDARVGAQGLLFLDEPRGVAWALRNIVDAAYWLPDAYPAKAYLRTKAQNNVTALDAYAAKGGSFPFPHPLKMIMGQGESVDLVTALRVTGRSTVTQLVTWIPWMQAYMSWAFTHANQLGFTGSLATLRQLASIYVALFTDPGIPRAHAMGYHPIVGENAPDANGALVFTPYMTWQRVHDTSAKYWGDAQDGSSSGCPAMASDGYGVQGRLGLLSAIALGVGSPQAEESLTWLMNHTDAQGHRMVDAVNLQYPEFALDASSLGLQ